MDQGSVGVSDIDDTASVELDSLRDIVVIFERGIRWSEVKPDWNEIRPEWGESVRNAQCIEDLFQKTRFMMDFLVEDMLPPIWKEEKFQADLKRALNGSTAKDLVKLVHLCSSAFLKKAEIPREVYVSLFTTLLQFLRLYVLKGLNLSVLFPQVISDTTFVRLSRAMKRLELGINWSGVLPVFRDLRPDWIGSLSNASTLAELVEIWKTFESNCNWENLGPTFIPLRADWSSRLSKCNDEITLARLMLEMESHCVPERLSGIYRSQDRSKWRRTLASITTAQEIPSLQSICAKKIIVSDLPRDELELPPDCQELLEDLHLVHSLIGAGARDETFLDIKFGV